MNMRPYNSLRCSKGSSLIEILVAVSVLGLLVAGFSNSTISLTKGNTTSGKAAAAAALTHDLVEQFRALDPADDPGAFAAGPHVDPSSPVNENGEYGGIFNRTWTVTRDSPRRGLAEIVITVAWNAPTANHLTSVTYVCTTASCN